MPAEKSKSKQQSKFSTKAKSKLKAQIKSRSSVDIAKIKEQIDKK